MKVWQFDQSHFLTFFSECIGSFECNFNGNGNGNNICKDGECVCTSGIDSNGDPCEVQQGMLCYVR